MSISIKNRSKAMNKDFGDNFVDDIVKGNGTKIFVSVVGGGQS